MDLVPGGSLREHLRQHGTLPPATAADILAQIAAALTEAHGLGVVHRDLKPDNILLTRSATDTATAPCVRLTDFGIARVLDAAGLTTPEALIGTPNYLAPETIDGGRPTPAVDVYAMGILLYELVAGRPPYAGGPPVTVLRRHLECSPHRYPDVPDEVWRVITACMDKDPARRPPAATLVTTLHSLARLTAGIPAMAMPPAPPFGTTSVPLAREPGTAEPGSSPRSPARRPGRRLGRLPGRQWLLILVVVLAGAALAAGLAGVPGWNLLDRGGARDVGGPVTPHPRPSGGPSPTPPPAAPSAGGSPGPVLGATEARHTRLPQVVPPVKVGAHVFGPLQCPDAYTWDAGHPVVVKPCHATGPAIRLVGRMQAVPGVQADISLRLEDADTGAPIGETFTCDGMMFTDFKPEHDCGPFDVKAVRGKWYVVVQTWAYTGRGILPGGTATSEPFRW
jgi:serine/threonine-protein kinase